MELRKHARNAQDAPVIPIDVSYTTGCYIGGARHRPQGVHRGHIGLVRPETAVPPADGIRYPHATVIFFKDSLK